MQRNRCRRIIREAFRQQTPSVGGGFDIVFVARSRAVSLKSTDIAAVMAQHLAELGVVAT